MSLGIVLGMVGCGGQRPLPAADGPLPAIADDAQGAEWWSRAVIYEVYVRSFADSDGDGHGDLAGLTARLDTLNDGDPNTHTDLGVDALWLMPIHPSPSTHGYDVSDYRDVHPDYGTLEDFDAFIRAADQRGIKVVMDLVLNHSSSKHPWFVQAELQDAGMRERYRFSDTRQDHPRPWDGASTWHRAGDAWYYALFWSGMPDLNLEHPAVFNEMVGTARFWAQRGVAGFRVDAARYLVEDGEHLADTEGTHRLMKRFRHAADPQSELLWLAEAWTSNRDVLPYAGNGLEFDRAFDFELASAIAQALKDASPDALIHALGDTVRDAAPPGFFAAFTENHDRARLGSQLEPAALLQALALLLVQPTTVSLYYGQELGMRGGGHQGDQAVRTPLRWTSDAPAFGFSRGTPWLAMARGEPASVQEQQQDPRSLWRATEELLSARRAMVSSTLRAERWGEHGLVLRGDDFQAWYNLSGDTAVALPAFGGATVLFERGLGASAEGSASPQLAPRGVVWLKPGN